MNLEVKNLMETADLLLATLAYNSNMPVTYTYKEEDWNKKKVLGDRKILVPNEEEMTNVLESLITNDQHVSFLSQMGFTILNDEVKEKMASILNMLYEKYQRKNNINTCLLYSKVLIHYPEEQIQNYLNSTNKYFLESGKEFTENFLNLHFLMQCQTQQKRMKQKVL